MISLVTTACLQRLKPVHTAYIRRHLHAHQETVLQWAQDVNGRDRDETEMSASRDRDVDNFSRDETETRRYVSRPSRDRNVETETTTLPCNVGQSDCSGNDDCSDMMFSVLDLGIRRGATEGGGHRGALAQSPPVGERLPPPPPPVGEFWYFSSGMAIGHMNVS